MDYFRADTLLRGKKRYKDRYRLAPNTWLVRMSTDSIAIRFHRTDIITLFLDGHIQLNTGGWTTFTTKERLNRFSPYSVESKHGDWFIRVNGNPYGFRDGMEIATDGAVAGYRPVKEIYESWKCRTRARYWKNKASNSPSRLSPALILQEQDYSSRSNMARVFGWVNVLEYLGQTAQDDGEYQLLFWGGYSHSRIYGLKCKADNTIALVSRPTIQEALFEALTNGFQRITYVPRKR